MVNVKWNCEIQELIWGPAPAINPLAKQQQAPKTQIHHNNNGTDAEANKKQQKKKGKMQKIDASALLGFTVHAGDRVNMGEIDSIDSWTKILKHYLVSDIYQCGTFLLD